MPRSLAVFLALVLLVLAVVAIVLGVLYLHDGPKALPSFIPGHHPHGKHPYKKRGVAALVVGAVLLIVSAVSARLGRRRAVVR